VLTAPALRQCLTQECDDEDELDEFEVFDIPAYEEVHPEEAVSASPLTPVHGRACAHVQAVALLRPACQARSKMKKI
jgi:hypothetical protein